jgi:hypothetical protein
MRTCRLSMWLLLMGLVAGMSAAVAKADGAPDDPDVTIHKCAVGTVCDLGSFTGTSDQDPIIVTDADTTTNFEYVGTNPVGIVYVQIVPASESDDSYFENDETFGCEPGLAKTCNPVSPAGPLPAVEFVFVGDVVDGVVQPFLNPGDILSVDVTPEPGTVLLLLAGLISVFAVSFKRTSAGVA